MIFGIVNAQSMKMTGAACQSGYDAEKNVRGIKRHLAVDSEGLPQAIEVTTAAVNDCSGALLMFLLHQETLAEVTKVLVDGVYAGTRFERLVWQIIGAKVAVVKRNGLHTFAVLPQCRIVERSLAWLEKCQRLWKNCERKLETSLQLVVLAFLALLLRRHYNSFHK